MVATTYVNFVYTYIQIHQLTKDYDKLNQEHARLRGALERERKEAQTKVDIGWIMC